MLECKKMAAPNSRQSLEPAIKSEAVSVAGNAGLNIIKMTGLLLRNLNQVSIMGIYIYIE